MRRTSSTCWAVPVAHFTCSALRATRCVASAHVRICLQLCARVQESPEPEVSPAQASLPSTKNHQYVASASDCRGPRTTACMQINQLHAHEAEVTALALSASLDQVASAAADGSICVFDLHTGKELWRLSAPAPVSCLAISRPATHAIKELVVGTAAGHVLLYRKVRV